MTGFSLILKGIRSCLASGSMDVGAHLDAGKALNSIGTRMLSSSGLLGGFSPASEAEPSAALLISPNKQRIKLLLMTPFKHLNTTRNKISQCFIHNGIFRCHKWSDYPMPIEALEQFAALAVTIALVSFNFIAFTPWRSGSDPRERIQRTTTSSMEIISED